MLLLSISLLSLCFALSQIECWPCTSNPARKTCHDWTVPQAALQAEEFLVVCVNESCSGEKLFNVLVKIKWAWLISWIRVFSTSTTQWYFIHVVFSPCRCFTATSTTTSFLFSWNISSLTTYLPPQVLSYSVRSLFKKPAVTLTSFQCRCDETIQTVILQY